ncbi:MAG: DUF4105 domain-containing protein [Helicobacteraceae bacterium]|jgi:hypothetical protein|nr:DUF4105 domain-containing protein [Helicobacteraceae bacterium]
MRLFLLLFFPIILFAGYAQELKTKAIELDIANQKEWLAVTGYKSALLGGFENEIDDRRYFLAKDGKTNPQSELLATIDSFFVRGFDGNESLDTRCIYKARWNYLKETLPIDESRLENVACDLFDHWYGGVSGDRLILVFTAAYMNNPASMFGHTFLRVDRNDSVNALTSYAVNYAADMPPDENGFVYSILGLMGGYSGYFSALPYAEKAKEYGNLENRDIWEFDLNFSRKEIDRLLFRAWELSYFARDYYFFKENCSFVLLELLEYAKGDSDFTSRFHGFAAPIDTVRAVINAPDMLKSAVFRPARATRILHLAQSGDKRSVDTALALSYGKISPAEAIAALDKEEAIAAFNLAMEYCEYLNVKNEIDYDQYKASYFALMAARSSLGIARDPPKPIVAPPRPDQGHMISRVALGAGYDNEDKPSVNFRVRPSYHDIVDPLAGYAAGSSISAGDLWIQHADDKTRIRKFTVMNIESFAIRDRFFKPISWRVDLGWRDNPPSLPSGGYGYFKGGAALSWGSQRAIFYLGGDMEAQTGKKLRDDRAFYAGGSAGAILSPSDRLRVRFEAKRDYDLTDDNAARTNVKLDSSYALETNLAVRLEFAGEKRGEAELNEAFLFIDYFF